MSDDPIEAIKRHPSLPWQITWPEFLCWWRTGHHPRTLVDRFIGSRGTLIIGTYDCQNCGRRFERTTYRSWR